MIHSHHIVDYRVLFELVKGIDNLTKSQASMCVVHRISHSHD